MKITSELKNIIKEKGSSITIPIIVKVGAKNDAIGEVKDNMLKISVKSRAIEGEANKNLIRLIAEHFGLPKSKVEILHGHKSRRKVVMINNVTLTETPNEKR